MIDTPKRNDGSRYWIKAGFCDDKTDEERFTEEELAFKEKCDGSIKTNNLETGEFSMQYDGYANREIGIRWREFGTDDSLRKARRMASLILKQDSINEYDKETIASFTEQGYTKMINGELKFLIPFLFADEWKQYQAVWETIHQEIGQNFFADFIENYAESIEKEIPQFIRKEEKIYIKYSVYPQCSVLYWLADNGLLQYPTDEEAKRLCTIVWCDRQEKENEKDH